MLMKERNISQKELAKASGISESTISRYLHSEQRPRMDNVINIAHALHVGPEYLIDKDEKSESYDEIVNAIARGGKELTNDQRKELIKLILEA